MFSSLLWGTPANDSTVTYVSNSLQNNIHILKSNSSTRLNIVLFIGPDPKQGDRNPSLFNVNPGT